MGDRRNLLGTSAVLVGLSSALITGTAVAAADTGGTDTRQGDGASAANSTSDSTAPAAKARRAGTRSATATSPAPAAATNDDLPAAPRGRSPRGGVAEADAVVRQPDTNKPAPAATEAPAAQSIALAQPQQDVVVTAAVTPAPAATAAPSSPRAAAGRRPDRSGRCRQRARPGERIRGCRSGAGRGRRRDSRRARRPGPAALGFSCRRHSGAGFVDRPARRRRARCRDRRDAGGGRTAGSEASRPADQRGHRGPGRPLPAGDPGGVHRRHRPGRLVLPDPGRRHRRRPRA